MSNKEEYLFYYEYDGDEFGVIDQDDGGKLTVRNLGSEKVLTIDSNWLAEKMETMEVDMSLER